MGARFKYSGVVAELMSRAKDDTTWICRGRQRAAVARVLRKPMTTSEICTAAREFTPRIQLRDVWYLLQQMRERDLVRCLNPHHVTGKLYELTLRGRRALPGAFDVAPTINARPASPDWRKYARVVRAKVRRAVLLAVARSPSPAHATAAALRRRLREDHGLGLNATIRALQELEGMNLVRSKQDPESGRRCYTLTAEGGRVLIQLES